MTQATTQGAIEAAKATVQAMAAARAEAGTGPRSEAVNTRSKPDRPH